MYAFERAYKYLVIKRQRLRIHGHEARGVLYGTGGQRHALDLRSLGDCDPYN